jgi:LmbE family N-acetylglucosaminyl deacetylase
MSFGYTLLLLPHQDDELFITNWIKAGLSAGQSYVCFFLTDGGAQGSTTSIRNDESLSYLMNLGLPRENIHFLGTEMKVADAKLVYSLELLSPAIEKKIASLPITEIICPAWEGGHQDHDAAHLLALDLAAKKGLLAQTWQYYLYNGFHSRGKFFRVMHPIFKNSQTRILKLSLGNAIKTAFACFHYRSQMKTWVGLFPQIFGHYFFCRDELLNPVSLAAIRDRPHAGALLYERYQRMSFADFRENTATIFNRLEKDHS